MCDCSCKTTCYTSQCSGGCKSTTLGPQPPYNIPYTGPDTTLRNNWLESQQFYDSANPKAPFTTNPNWPLDKGSNMSQIVTNQQNKTIFNYLNTLKEKGQLFKQARPTFSSDQERLQYINAQYAQAAYIDKKKGINTLYSFP